MTPYFKHPGAKTGIRLITLLFLFSLFTTNKIFAQVGVNILTPHSSSAIQIESPIGTAKGLLTPSMTTVQRMTITTGTNVAADGLVVYDKDHHMHYYYNGTSHRWTSLSPLTLSTPTVGSTSFPSGVITTPSSSATFSLGINKQNPVQALDVVGNTTVSGNITSGGNITIAGNATLNANTTVNGSLSVAGFANNALVPTGLISMWSGSLVPKGWAVCDGGIHNGLQTPDLRGKFIVGINNAQGAMDIPTNQYVALSAFNLTPTVAPPDGTTNNYGALGNTGGETGHVLSMAEMPTHTHSVSATLGNNFVFGFNSFGNTSIGSGSAFGGDPQYTSVSITETAKGSDQIHENRPPYYVLAYIIKLP